jgi:hypothetical protein
MRIQLALFAAIAAVFTFMTYSAQAVPAAQLQGVAKATDQVIQVRDGCGPGRHRGPHGHCRWNRW